MGRDAVSLGALFNNNSNFSNNNRPYSLMPHGRPAPKLSILLYTDKPGCRAHENDELKDSEKSPAPAGLNIWTFLCTYKNANELTHQPWSAVSAISISLPIVWRNYKYYSIVCSCVHYFIDFSLVSWTPQPCQTGKRAHTLQTRAWRVIRLNIIHLMDKQTCDWQLKDTGKWKISLWDISLFFPSVSHQEKKTHSPHAPIYTYYFEYIFLKLYIVIM